MRAELFEHMSERDYHSDLCVASSLSVSVAKVLLDKSPRHAHMIHPRLGGERWEPSDKMDIGSLAHKLMLGKGADVHVVDADDWRPKAAKEERDKHRALGEIVVLRKVMGAAPEIAERWRDALLQDHAIELSGSNEVTVLWHEKTPHGPIWCRCRIDNLDLESGVIRDLKLTEVPHTADALSRHFASMDYALQAYTYRRAIELWRPELAGRLAFQFIALELANPYCATPVEPDGSCYELGELRWRRACNLWGACLNTGKWPGYGLGNPVRVYVPAWQLTREYEEDHDETI